MSACPSRHELERLLDEQLTDADFRAVSLHVSECPDCQSALEHLTADTEVSGVCLSLARPSTGPAEPETLFLARLKQSPLDGRPDGAAGRLRQPGAAPPGVPGYEVVRELGRGGMGVVYQARQRGLNRSVALKMILAGPHAGEKNLARFRQEAEAVARLHHPNIVQVYEIGEAAGVKYIALEYVEGGNLGQHLHGDPQPVEPTVRLIETLARTVHFAHQRDIVHRDLKPANVLLQLQIADCRLQIERQDARGVDRGARHDPQSAICNLQSAIPKITDFGLAKRLDAPGDGSHSGEVVGTPSYMAPEQAGGRNHLVGPATDVYALGAILYEMLTGRPPFKGATPVDTIVQVLHEEPVRPGSLRPHLPPDLETICLKCLSKDPARRYGSGAALADDLQRFRTGKPILARRARLPERAWKWARRRPLIAGLLAGMVLSAVTGFAGITWQWQEATWARDAALAEQRAKEQQRLKAEKARAEAIDERRRAQVALYFSRIAQGQLQWRVNNVVGAVQSLFKCVPADGQEDQRGWEWYYLLGLFHSDLVTLTHPVIGAGGAAAFHPDGRTVASVIGGHPADDESHPGEVRVWDSTTGALLRRFRAPGTAHRLAYRPDGKRLALATTDGSVLVWDADTGDELLRTRADGPMVQALAFSPDGGLLALASWDRTVKVCDAATGAVKMQLVGHAARVQAIAFSADGKRLASGGGDSAVKVWDARTGEELRTFLGHKSPVYGVAFSPDGTLLASGSSNGNLKIWDLDTGKAIQSLTSNSGAVLGNSFSPDGRYLAYCGGDGTVRVWDVESGVQRLNFRGHTAPAESVQFSPDGQRLVSASPQEGTVKVWDVTRHPEYGTFARVRGRADEQVKVRDLTERADAAPPARTGPDLEALAFHADGKHLVSVAVGGKLQTWDAATGVLKEQRTVDLCDELITPAVLAAFTADGTRLAGRARDDRCLVKAWDVAAGTEVAAFRGHTLPVLVVRFSPDGRRLVSCGCDLDRPDRPHEVKVWDAATAQCLATLTGRGLLSSAAFSPDGSWLALAAQDGAVLLADWAGSKRVVRLAGHRSPVAAVAFSHDGRLLASAGVEDRVLKIWELVGFNWSVDFGLPKAFDVAAPPFLCDLAFSPDGKRLAGISRDVVKLWDVGTRHEVMTLRGAPQRHWDPAFNPRVLFSPDDGKRLVGTNWDESISMWDASISGDDDALARHQATRRWAAEARAAFWHLEEAEDCWQHQNRPAARFHLLRLGSVPLPAPLQARKDRLATALGE
jgi:WD40 repeat protein/serine/threonine protein kinase